MNIKEKGNKLLIIDDDPLILSHFEYIFKNHYDLQLVNSAIQAQDKLRGGYRPSVILCDQVLPEMTGIEFLANSIEITPESVRLIMTASNDPKVIVESINKAKIFMFVSKPVPDLQLIQMVKVAFNHYNEISDRNFLNIHYKKTIKQYENEIEKYQLKVQEGNNDLLEVVKILSGISTINDKYYFTNHTSNVTQICRGIADEFEIDINKKNSLVLAALLHNIFLFYLEDKLVFKNITDLNEDDLKKYFTSFKIGLENLKFYKKLNNALEITEMLFEKYDGSGYPKGISGNYFSLEGQILSLANFYHNFVYKLSEEQYSILKSKGQVVQEKEITLTKHKEFISHIYKNIKWYDNDLLKTFNTIINRKSIEALVPSKNDLLLLNKDNESLFYNSQNSEINNEINIISDMIEHENNKY